MKTDLTRNLLPIIEGSLSERVANCIEKMSAEEVKATFKKWQPIMLPSQMETIERIMRIKDMRTLMKQGFQKINLQNGDGVMVCFMPEDMHTNTHGDRSAQSIISMMSEKIDGWAKVEQKHINFFEQTALMNCVDEVHWESGFIKKTCNTKVEVRFEGQHPVPFYHKGRW